MKNGEYRAIYEDGVFKPIDAVALPERTEVIVRCVPAVSAKDREAAKKQAFEALSRSYETGQSDLAARHNEHQP